MNQRQLIASQLTKTGEQLNEARTALLDIHANFAAGMTRVAEDALQAVVNALSDPSLGDDEL